MPLADVFTAGRRLSRRVLGSVVGRRHADRGSGRVIVLHVGAHKTGSSVVQSLLKSEADRLRRYGVFYERGFYRLGRTLARSSSLTATDRNAQRLEIQSRLGARREPLILGSAEGLFGDPFASYSNIRAVAEDLRAILEGEQVQITACIRRQDEFVQSLYHQHVKLGGALTFERFVALHDIHAYKWDELVCEYADVFGRDNVTVCCYDEVFRAGVDPLAAIFPPLGRAGFRTRSSAPIINPALSRKGVEMAIRCNDLLTPDEQKIFRRFLEQEFPRLPGEPHGLFTPQQRQDLLDFYAPSNLRCFEEFLASGPHPTSHWLGDVSAAPGGRPGGARR